MENDKIQNHVDLAIISLGQNVEVKGFRKGKAPKQMIIDQVGLGRVQQEVLDKAMQEGYLAAVTEHKFSPISQPAVSLKKFNLKSDGLVDGDLEYELTVDLMPEIELGDYTKIKVKDKKIVDQKLEVTKEEVEKVLEHLQRQKSVMEDVDRKVEDKDWVEISFTGTLNKVPLEKLASSHHPLIIGSKSMVPGFEDTIIGMAKDQEKVTDITFPKDYFSKEFAGKKVEFTITVHKIKKIDLPKLDGKFAEEFGHDSVEKLKEAIKAQLLEEKEEQKKSQIDSLILDEAKKLMKVEIPEGLITQEIHRMIDRSKESIEKQGVDFEQYLQSMKKTHDDLHKDYYNQAKSNIEVGFLLGEIIKREKLDEGDKQAPTKALDVLKKYALGEKVTQTEDKKETKVKSAKPVKKSTKK